MAPGYPDVDRVERLVLPPRKLARSTLDGRYQAVIIFLAITGLVFRAGGSRVRGGMVGLVGAPLTVRFHLRIAAAVVTCTVASWRVSVAGPKILQLYTGCQQMLWWIGGSTIGGIHPVEGRRHLAHGPVHQGFDSPNGMALGHQGIGRKLP